MMRYEVKNIVILGAGYGGIQVAQKLSGLLHGRKDCRIIVVNKNDYHMLKTQLYKHAAGTAGYSRMMIPLADILDHENIEFYKGQVDLIDTKNKLVKLNQGEVVLHYHYLVLALGSELEYYNIEGLEENSIGLTSLNCARTIRCQVKTILEKTAFASVGPPKNKLHFVIGGGGLTGVELTGELAYQLQKVCSMYNLGPDDYHITLVEGCQNLLPGMSEKSAQYAKKALEQQGVEVITGDLLKKVTPHTIELASGRQLNYSLLFWSGGVRGNHVVAESGLKVDGRGRLLVNEYLQSVDDPCIYGVGDSALVIDPTTNKPMLATAQASMQHGRQVAYNIYADITKQKKKAFSPKGIILIINIGKNYALAEGDRLVFNGPLAVFIKKLVPIKYAYQLGGWKLIFRNFIRHISRQKYQLLNAEECNKA